MEPNRGSRRHEYSFLGNNGREIWSWSYCRCGITPELGTRCLAFADVTSPRGLFASLREAHPSRGSLGSSAASALSRPTPSGSARTAFVRFAHKRVLSRLENTKIEKPDRWPGFSILASPRGLLGSLRSPRPSGRRRLRRRRCAPLRGALEPRIYLQSAESINDTAHARWAVSFIGVPKGIRTPVTAVKGRCPGPLDDGDCSGNLYPSDRQAGLGMGCWWSQAGSNRRPLACHASALPAELWPHAKRRFYGSPNRGSTSPQPLAAAAWARSPT